MEVITVFNKYFERIDVLRKYTFMQYVDKFNGVGEFKINAILCDENLYFLMKMKCFSLLLMEWQWEELIR